MVAIYSELLKKRFGGQLGAEGDEYIGFTVQGATRMQDLLRNLRLYTQISTENYQPPTEVDAQEVLQKILRSLEFSHPGKRRGGHLKRPYSRSLIRIPVGAAFSEPDRKRPSISW